MTNKKMMMLKKIIIAGIPAGLFLAIAGAMSETANITLYLSTISFNVKDWMISVLFYNFMVGLILVLVYNAVYKGLQGDNPVTKGLFFGILVWMLQTLPNIINAFIHTPQFSDVIRMELTTGFVAYPLVGVIIATTFQRYIEKDA